MEKDLLKDLKIVELPNKLQVWYKEVANTNLVSLRLVIMVGSAHQNIDDLGLAHFVEHLVFNFANERNNNQHFFDEIKQSGGYLNAETKFGSTIFIADIPSSKFERCLELIENCFLHLDFSEETISNERRVILNELQNESNEFWYDIYRELLGKHALAYSGIGTSKTLKKINKSKIESFFRKYYSLSKMVLICVGDINLQKVLDRVKSNLDKIQNNTELKEHYLCPEPKEKIIKIFNPLAAKSIIYGYRVCGYFGLSKDYFCLWFIRDYLENLLFDFVRDKGILYEINVGYNPYNFVGLFLIYVRYIKNGRKALMKKIKLEVDNLKTNPIKDNEFEKSKDFSINQFLSYIKDSKELANYYVWLAEGYNHKEGLKNPIAELESLTPADIRQAANKYFILNKLFVVRASIIENLFPVLGFLILISIIGNIFRNYFSIYSSFVLKVFPFVFVILVIIIVRLIIDRKKLLRKIEEIEKEKQKYTGNQEKIRDPNPTQIQRGARND